MTQLPQGFYEGELYCFTTGKAPDGQFGIIPGSPVVAQHNGQPAMHLMSMGDAAAFSLQCAWYAGETELAAARAAIAERSPELEDVLLEAAELEDVEATLGIVDAEGYHHIVGPEPASGMSGNQVVFSVTLDGAAQAAASRALRGEAGILTLTYTAKLALQESVAVEAKGDLAPTVKALAVEKPHGLFGKKPAPTPPTLEACAAAVAEAIARGQLSFNIQSSPNASSALLDKASTALQMQLAKLLLDRLQQLGADAHSISSLPVSLKAASPEQVSFTIKRTVDLGDLASRRDAQH